MNSALQRKVAPIPAFGGSLDVIPRITTTEFHQVQVAGQSPARSKENPSELADNSSLSCSGQKHSRILQSAIIPSIQFFFSYDPLLLLPSSALLPYYAKKTYFQSYRVALAVLLTGSSAGLLKPAGLCSLVCNPSGTPEGRQCGILIVLCLQPSLCANRLQICRCPKHLQRKCQQLNNSYRQYALPVPPSLLGVQVR